jgi:2-aminoadipate transaminase
MKPLPVGFSEHARRTKDSPISYFMQQAVENPRLISLAAGLVDAASLPAGPVQDAIDNLLATPERARAALQYGTTQGYLPLREKLVEHVARMDGVTPGDLSLTADDVVITTGSQQLLYLLAELLLDPGDIVLTEAPSYFVYQGTLESFGVRTPSVPMDEHGLRLDALEQILDRLEYDCQLERVKMIYTCDYFQNPSGLTLSRERRGPLVELARRYSRKQRILILEDAAYRELRYEGEDLPSVKRFDPDNRHVIQAMTFSKPCAPGLKTGYGVLPRDLVAPLLRLKGNHDFGSNNFTQHLLDRLLETGAYARHAGELRNVYRRKRDVLLQALAAEFGPRGEDDHLGGTGKMHWTHPAGGLYVWLSFPRSVDTGPDGPLMAAALREGVLYVPGQFCYVAEERKPVPTWEVRLSFGVVSEEQLVEGVRRLGRAAAACGATVSSVRAS